MVGKVLSRPSADVAAQFGDIDIYLFDQILRGRFDARPRVLDAGCGSGRNLVWLLRQGFEVFAVDESAAAITAMRDLAGRVAPTLPTGNIQVALVEAMPWPEASMDAVVCSAVLHFASDEAHFGRMITEIGRVLRPGGLFFARLASSIGLEARLAQPVGRVRLPDGSMRFVVSERLLLDWTARLGGELLDPIKTTNVQGLRCMTTWCVEKR